MILTAISPVLGLISIVPTVFRGPMVIAIIGGLLAQSVLTVVFPPAAYVAVFGNEKSVSPAVTARPA
jgi:multidrug efflux pump subunit AcrB